MNKHRGRESNIYIVERLIKRRVRMSKVEYLVKWKNWPDKHNTWEPDENILDRELIKSFNDEEERRKEAQAFAETKTIQGANVNATPLAKNPMPTKTTVPASPPAKVTTDLGERVQKPLSVSVTPSLGSPGPVSAAGSHPTSLYQYHHKNPEAPTSGSSIATAGSSTSTPVSSLGYDTTISPDGDWHSENRLRKTTLLVATASQSNARQSSRSAIEYARTGLPIPSRGSQLEVASNAVTVVSVSTNPNTTNAAVTTVRVESTDRPKIRLTIPRERLIVCQAASIDSSQESSCLLRDLEDGEKEDADDAEIVENPSFRAPLEMPRRAATDVDVDDGCLTVPPPSLLPTPEISEPGDSSLPKVVLSTKRVISSTWPANEKLLLTTKKESRHPKKKRRRESGSGSSSNKDYSSQRRHRSGSSASSCVSFSSTSPAVSPALPTNESPPRIAPLRIQLSRSNSVVQYPGPNDPTDERPFYRVAASAHHHHHRSLPPQPLSAPPVHRPHHLEREISITDVTVGNLTIAIKECPTPSNFFGIPSCQLVAPSRPPLAPRRPGVKSVYHPDHRKGASPMEVSDENMEPPPPPTPIWVTTTGNAELSVIVEEEERKDASADLSMPAGDPPLVTSSNAVGVPDGEVPPSPPRRASTPIQPPLIDLSSSSTSSSSTSTTIVTAASTTTPALLEPSQEQEVEVERNTVTAVTDAVAAVTPASDGPQNPRSIKAARLGGAFWAGAGSKRPKRRVPLLPRTNTKLSAPRAVALNSTGPPKIPSHAENVYTFRGDSPPPLTAKAMTPAVAAVTLSCSVSSSGSTLAQGKETDEPAKRPNPPALPPPPLSQVSSFQGLYNAAQPHQRLPPPPSLPNSITLGQLVAATTSAAAAMAGTTGWFPEAPPAALTPFPSLMTGDHAPLPYSFYPFLVHMHQHQPPSAPVSGAGGFFSSTAPICPITSPVAVVEPEDMPIDLSAKR